MKNFRESNDFLPAAGLASDAEKAGAATEKSWFTATDWTAVVAAGRPDEPEAREALARLCAAYWHPIYSYIRRAGHSPEDAQDLTQGFFARVLEKNYFAQADRQKGKFRSFLLAALKHFLSKERERTRRAKRGGRYRFVSWDESEAEERYEAGTSHELTAQRVFERSWAMTLLEKVFEDLRQEYAAIGKSRLFEALQPSLAGEQESGALTRVASDLNMSKGAARMAVLRLRRRYAQLLRFEIAHTVRRPEQIDNEIRCLFDAWN